MKALPASRVQDWIGKHGAGPESVEAVVAAELGLPPPNAQKGPPCSFVSGGAEKTFIEGRPAARQSGLGTHGRTRITSGAAKVLEGRDRSPIARVGEKVSCGGVILEGAHRTLVGGPSG